MDELEQFAYLWDGSEPDWVLVETDSYVLPQLVFATTGPTLAQVSVARGLLPELGTQSSAEAFKYMRGQSCVPLERRTAAAAEVLAAQCLKVGLSLEWVPVPGKRLLPVRSSTSALIIEDDELAAAVVSEAVRRGVPVISHIPINASEKSHRHD
ncbi:hypothetical protein [Stenotrophomonas sp.]|uniref:hypothetical protein n=1 Tax=Stenotrophomonas sp. TaxID=69392 RepID=UPI0028968450|nr:hypothetical protein [Stenotrophomonas sp.]